MSRRHVTTHPHLVVSLSTALFLLSVGVTAQRFLPSLDPAVVPEKLKSFVPVTDDMLLRPRPENCITYRNGYPLWGYSSLKQINAGNVGIKVDPHARPVQPRGDLFDVGRFAGAVIALDHDAAVMGEPC